MNNEFTFVNIVRDKYKSVYLNILKENKITAILVILFFCVLSGYSQSKSGVGLRFGINKPLSSDYAVRGTGALQGNFAFGPKWGIEITSGYEHLTSDLESHYNNNDYFMILGSVIRHGGPFCSGKVLCE